MQVKRRVWVVENPNAVRDIAAECKVSAQMVSLVLHGERKSKTGAVERALKRRQAPGITS